MLAMQWQGKIYDVCLGDPAAWFTAAGMIAVILVLESS
jgi:hypothetical protein